MKTLIEKAVEKIDPKFNPRIESGELVVNVPGESKAQRFFEQQDNEIKLTDNFSYLAPEEFNSYLEACEKDTKFKSIRFEDFKSLFGKNISYEYIDHDNGLIKGTGVINNFEQDKDAYMRYSVQMEVTSGEALTHFYLYEKNGFVLAGDDSGEIRFMVVD